MNPAKKEGNQMFQPSKEAQLQMIIYELQQANYELQKQLADARNQILIRSELIAKIGPDWQFDPKSRTFTKVMPTDPPANTEELAVPETDQSDDQESQQEENNDQS